jgi:ferredoxin
MDSQRRLVTADPGLCAESLTCVGLAPELFEIDSQSGEIHVITAVIDDSDLIARALEAEDCCPTRAISVLQA